MPCTLSAPPRGSAMATSDDERTRVLTVTPACTSEKHLRDDAALLPPTPAAASTASPSAVPDVNAYDAAEPSEIDGQIAAALTMLGLPESRLIDGLRRLGYARSRDNDDDSGGGGGGGDGGYESNDDDEGGGGSDLASQSQLHDALAHSSCAHRLNSRDDYLEYVLTDGQDPTDRSLLLGGARLVGGTLLSSWLHGRLARPAHGDARTLRCVRGPAKLEGEHSTLPHGSLPPPSLSPPLHLRLLRLLLLLLCLSMTRCLPFLFRQGVQSARRSAPLSDVSRASTRCRRPLPSVLLLSTADPLPPTSFAGPRQNA